MKTETLKTPSFEMEYFRFGQGDRPFVILPGLSVQSVMASADAVAKAYRLLADDFTVYVFDPPKSIPEAYSVRDLAADTAEAFKQLGLKNATVFGTSKGGMNAMVIAAEHPQLVDCLIIASSTAHVTEKQFGVFDKWIKLAEKPDPVELYLSFGEFLYSEKLFKAAKFLYIQAAKSVTGPELERFITLAEGMRGFDVREELSRISCPVLAIWDREDRIFGCEDLETTMQSFEGMQNVQTYLYEGYGHAVYDCAPDFASRLLAFAK